MSDGQMTKGKESMSENYSVLEQVVKNQRALLTEAKLPKAESALATAWGRLNQPEFHVLLIGEYNRGKSTLLNALAGRELFVSSAIQQSTINMLRYSNQTSVIVTENDVSRSTPIETLPIAGASKVDVSLTLDILADQLVLTEFPTLSEPLNVSDTGRENFQNEILNADLIVMVLSSDSLYSNTERTRLETELVNVGHSEILFVCNFIDRLSSSNLADIRTNAMQRLPAPPDVIFFTSALNSLENGIPDEGLSKLRDWLLALTADVRQKLRERRLYRLVNANLKVLRSAADIEISDRQLKQQDYDHHVGQFQKMLSTLKTNARHIDDEMNTFREQTRQVIEARTSTFFLELSSKIESWMRAESDFGTISMRQHEEVTEWQSEVTGYLKSRLKDQSESLKNSLATFDLQLKQIGDQIPTFSIPAMPLTESSQDPKLKVEFELPQPKRSDAQDGTPQNINLMDMPDVLVIAVGSVIVGFFVMPYIVIPTGLAIAGALAFNRFSNTRQQAKQQTTRTATTDLRRQSDEVTLQVAREAESYFAQIQDSVHESIQTIVADVERAIRNYLVSLRPDDTSGTAFDNRLKLHEQEVRAWHNE